MNNPQKETTCQDRIDSHLESRLQDLRILFYGPTIDDVQLIDDGTSDTVIEVYDQDYRFSDTSAYRDNDGILDIAEFWDSSECDSVREEVQEQFFEYGLSFDYIPAHSSQHTSGPGYFQWCLSTGGPADEFRFFVDLDGTCYKIEYWFLDWFDGAHTQVYSIIDKPAAGSDSQLMLDICDHFKECGCLFFSSEAKRQ